MVKGKSKKIQKVNPNEDPFKIIFHPYVTEKTMNLMERLNRLEFVVARRATKGQIKIAFEKLYDAKIEKINTMIFKDGKHAIIKLKPEYSAEEIGMRIGIF
jgi:large subunit ribosomal protein L23